MLTVHALSITFTMYDIGLIQKRLRVITDLDIDVRPGEIVAVIGSSGSGKSLLAHAILGLLPGNAEASGQMTFKGEPLTAARQRALRGREIVLIPQSVAYLDPLQQVGAQVRRAAELTGLRGRDASAAQERAFVRYGLTPSTRQLHPFQVSGGMARRVLMSIAAVGRANLLIADEPTPGLHPEAVAETLGHLRELADDGKAVILITHDLEAALQVSDRVAVFYAGTTLEMAPAGDFLRGAEVLRHPYSQALWRALPQNGFEPVAGAQPPPDDLPAGCLYARRCPLAVPRCADARPELRPVRGGWVRCHYA